MALVKCECHHRMSTVNFIDKNRFTSLESFLCRVRDGLCWGFYEVRARFQMDCGRNDLTSLLQPVESSELLPQTGIVMGD